jgi:hypothetical protein
MRITPAELMVTGVLGQATSFYHAFLFHLPLYFSGLLFGGGLGWAVAKDYWASRAEAEERERNHSILMKDET